MLLEVQSGEKGYSLSCGKIRIPCRVGRNGIVPATDKREGDGRTPAGDWMLRSVYFRADRVDRPQTKFECLPLTRQLGWCDAPDHPAYNTCVRLPFEASHEMLWRQDGAYDIIVVLGYNDTPVRPHRGSAIFFHCLARGQTETAGCVAVTRKDMLEILAILPADAVMRIRA